MKNFDVVVEYVVTGTVGVVVLLIPILASRDSTLLTKLPDDRVSQAVVGVLALPVIYYFGIGLHHASWWFWRRLAHRQLFKAIFKEPDRRSYESMRKLAKSAYIQAGHPLGPDPGWEAIVEWCRFALYHHCSEAAMREYARQHHLYRATYGPLFALVGGLGIAIQRAITGSLPLWSPFVALVAIAVLIHAGRYRGSRMWKSLCYSIGIGIGTKSEDARHCRRPPIQPNSAEQKPQPSPPVPGH